MTNLELKWLKAVGVRAIRTFAQGFLGAIGSAVMMSEVDWRVVFSTAALSMVVSIAMSLKGLPEVDEV